MDHLFLLPALGLVLGAVPTLAQDTLLLSYDEFNIEQEELPDEDPSFNVYDRFNAVFGADSIRTCNGYPCIGWVEDHYEDGTLKHRGYYDNGKLSVYKNYHPNGALEREFKSIDARKSIMRQYHANKNLRSQTRYVDGVALEYQDHYVNGQLRYHEEKHKSQPYYLRMDLYASNGDPISLFHLVDKKKVLFEMQEYHPGGVVRSTGMVRYEPKRMDSQRMGTWRIYDKQGHLVRVEEYVDGKVFAVK